MLAVKAGDKNVRMVAAILDELVTPVDADLWAAERIAMFLEDQESQGQRPSL